MLALAGVAVVVFALVALLVMYGAEVLGQWLSHVMPDIHIGPWHVGLGGPIRNLISASVSVIRNWLDSALGAMAQVILYPVYVVNHLFASAVSAVEEGYTTARWIVADYVPRVTGAAIANLWATVAANIRQVEAWLAADVAALNDRITANVATLLADIDAARSAASALIGANVRTLLADIDAAASAARSYATGLVDDLAATTATALAAVRAEIVTAEHVAAADTAALASTLSSTAATIEADIGRAESAAIAGAVGVISTDVSHAAAAVWGDLDSIAAGAAGVAADSFPDIKTWAESLSLSRVVDIAGVTGLSIATTRVLAKYLEECGMPNCRNLSKIGRDLQDLFGLFEDGAFLALLAELIADPIGAAREVQSVLGPVVDGVGTAARDLLGVG